MRALALRIAGEPRHAKAGISQTAFLKRGDHRVHIAACESDNTDAGMLERTFQGKADGAADQDIHADVRQLLDPAKGPQARKVDAFPRDFVMFRHVDQQEPFRHIENR